MSKCHSTLEQPSLHYLTSLHAIPPKYTAEKDEKLADIASGLPQNARNISKRRMKGMKMECGLRYTTVCLAFPGIMLKCIVDKILHFPDGASVEEELLQTEIV